MKNCLVVDDSSIVRRLVSWIVENIGFDCMQAENGQVALDLCKKSLPDVILLDWNMPVMNGMDFTRELRALPDGDRPKIIFCTMNNEQEEIEQALAAGADEYIMKPLDANIIKEKFHLLGLL